MRIFLCLSCRKFLNNMLLRKNKIGTNRSATIFTSCRCRLLGIVCISAQCIFVTFFLYSILPLSPTSHSELLEDGYDASKVFHSAGTRFMAVGSEILRRGGATRIGWTDRAPFAVLADVLEHVDIATKRLNEDGFKTVVFYSKLISKFPPKERTVPIGIAVKKRYPFYVIFLYSRLDNFWWYGSVLKDPDAEKKLALVDLTLEDVRTVQKEGIFKKVDMKDDTLGNQKMLVPQHIRQWYNFTNSNKFIECDYERAYNYLKKQGRNSDDTNIFQHKAWKVLSKAQVVLEFLKIPFWLSSGTLLGFYRECGIIPHTTDVDIGIFAKDYSPDIVKEFIFRGFYLKHVFGKVNDSYELSFVNGGIKLDIFFFYEEDDEMWNGGTQAKTGKKFKYVFPRFDLCWTEFLDLLVRVPCDTLTYIQANYGPEWFVPKRDWNWHDSPFNVHDNGVWAPDEIRDAIQVLNAPEYGFP